MRGPLVRKAFELYATGDYPYWRLVEEMGKRGLTSRNGKQYTKTAFEKILRNPFYCGIIKLSNGKTYNGIHEPLISVKLFEQVRAVREAKDNKKTTKHHHRYRRMFVCGYCGGGMIPERQKGYSYYRCHTKHCDTKTVREEVIEAEVQALLKRMTLTNAQVTTLRKKLTEYIDAMPSVRISQNATFELTKLKERISRLTDKFVDDLIDEETYQTKKEAFLLEQTKLERLVTEGSTKQTLLGNLDRFLERAKNLYFNYETAYEPEKRSLVKFATSNRRVTGKKVYLEPSNLLAYLSNAVFLMECAPYADKNRTKKPYGELIANIDDIDWPDMSNDSKAFLPYEDEHQSKR